MEIDTAEIDSRYDLPEREGITGVTGQAPLTPREEYLIDYACKQLVDELQRAGRI